MIIQLPLSSDPSQLFITQLGTIKYQFNIQYNDRAGFWTMDITDSSSATLLIAGLPIVLGCDLIGPYIFGNGGMLVFDETGSGMDAGDPDTNDLGNRVNVYWFSADKVAAIANGGV